MSSAYIYRIAMSVPAAQVEAARRIATALGWGEGCFAVPLSTTGLEPATHWGLSAAATQAFVDDLTAAAGGSVPAGADQGDLAAVMPVLAHQIGAASANPLEQFDGLIAAQGLSRMAPEDL